MKRICCSTAILLSTWASPSVASNVYLEVEQDNLCEYGQGWANYCTPNLIIEKPRPNSKPEPKQQIVVIQTTPKKPPKDPSDPLVWLENYQKEEKRARARMMMELTQESVEEYRRKNFKDVMDRGTIVSDLWRRTAWQNPDFDYTLQRPTGYLSKREHDLRRNEKVDASIADITKRYGIFFVFKSSDHNSVKFAPILSDFAEQHNLTVQGISVDGKPLPTWDKSWKPKANQILERLNLNSDYTPAIALYDRKENKAVPIGFGILAQDELANRLYVLTKLDVGEDY
ncbi:conjugal transfer protein TraF [Vibrio mediterranei]|uniref:Type-F conjugative transfer system pilin assembly protein TraF n=1 Tax=Vibrio mediterranei TaxID=689 RepID=A0ABX5D8X2_9VIBR|nr:conjugal transfer protein TraF [Vibrio mediterranei]MCG9658863.1 conjugal transfer protein TraF [Vibrio mediterranei]PRQ65111.1 hypothetical protein COR51_23610 [Vibrio mediterranei]